MGSQESTTDELDQPEWIESGDRAEGARRSLRDLFASRRAESVEKPAEQAWSPERLRPHEYIEPDPRHQDALKQQLESSGAPDHAAYLDKINPRHAEGPEWETNCGSAARAFALTYQTGEAGVASGRRNGEGEDTSVMHKWAAVQPESLPFDPSRESLADYNQRAWARLEERSQNLPDGTVLVVGVDWAGPPGSDVDGHWFNAVRVNSELHWVDAQDGRSGRWPPQFGDPIANIDAIHRSAADQSWKELDLAD